MMWQEGIFLGVQYFYTKLMNTDLSYARKVFIKCIPQDHRKGLKSLIVVVVCSYGRLLKEKSGS